MENNFIEGLKIKGSGLHFNLALAAKTQIGDVCFAAN